MAGTPLRTHLGADGVRDFSGCDIDLGPVI
jgi:hypothetical protein